MVRDVIELRKNEIVMINKVILIGNVGADPEIRTLESGVKMARIRIATTERIYVLSVRVRRSISKGVCAAASGLTSRA